MRSNNPYHRGAGLYELNLALPVISTIRRQEAAAVGKLIARYGDRRHRALEVGPGTGMYTLALAQAFGEVVAVEDSATMAGILGRRLAAAGATNVTVVNDDFMRLPVDGAFDVAVAIGVLDYVAEPAAFVARMCAATREALIITAPQRGLLGACFAAAARLRGIRVYRHHRSAPAAWAPGWRCHVAEVGLHTRLTRGLTLVAALEPRSTS
ncbi:MAG TPA: class I SAM-dependent methyltransferase [Armatimonadota bacterium]|nr:class I SAM-dependent methyltransferase [Armatimonadota bacterium]